MSHVIYRERTAARAAERGACPRSLHPMWSQSIADASTAPIGLATHFPAICGAEPCAGSNNNIFPRWDVFRRRKARLSLQLCGQIPEDFAK